MSAFTPLEVGIKKPFEGSNGSFSEGGTVTTSEGFIGSNSEVVVGIFGSVCFFLGIIHVVFAHVTCWCVHGASWIWAGAVSVIDICLVPVGVGAMFLSMVLKTAAICCNSLPCHPWIFWIAWIRVVSIHVASYICVSVGTVHCCG